MKHKTQSYSAEEEPLCKIPRIDDFNILETPLSNSILKRKQNHVHSAGKRKYDTDIVTDDTDDMVCETEAKKRKIVRKEIGSEVACKIIADDVLNEEPSSTSSGHSAEYITKIEKRDFSCFNFWRLPLPNIDLCEIG
ncbi:uncharacterized protein LOC117333848 [Pecten maximus]|uniref:uncharacterized protein LOC117333848 n=1 Tax=Pecten maximus TaxID=6579 RepID=UPI0014580A31|nr:uncharacterized protein LOC117333848 [Pecten maximus]